jgi:ABC-2 type transport system ATP-binding protein
VIVVELEDELELAAHTVRALSRVDDVTIGSRGLTISTSNGAALVAEIAIALNEIGVPSVSLTVRTPSLDDVFLRATGHRLLNASS